ncbi:MAG: hypothetical protein A2946_03280 [Candidatus Liptonbacteria bacterium RIFCSPLOWO2_01_FULL_53_13]|uniref:Uncharacterized protein n=1 Tax=Candidatus Liptonbacteria bacterium RIFCSPLOWO2_01_FULL_53_13 TaxID=1798651 RepID=A0A1G2CI07_9BACT|nr:MAG: hypothetical protein A2946_03280 [Candidatus Liptonbacteria bacterium RIFCSPLOWO2_01_FULL_53_13]
MTIHHSPFTIHHALRARGGQSLVEILVASAVGVVVIGAAVSVIVPALRGNTDAEERQSATAVGKELLESVRAFAESSWHNIDTPALALGPLNHYHLTSDAPFSLVSDEVLGPEIVTLDGKNYTRYFYLESAGRDGSGNILESGGTDDPSTRKITVIYGKVGGTERTLTGYLTRSKNFVTVQTDWSLGPGHEGLVDAHTPTESFSAGSGNINFTSTTGRIYLNLE